MASRVLITPTQEAWLRKAWADPEITREMICRRLGVGDHVMKRWVSELALGPKSGQPGDWTDLRVSQLRAYHAERLSCATIAGRFASEHGLDVSANTIRLGLTRLGLVPHVRRRAATVQPHVTVRPGQGFIHLPPLGRPDQPCATVRAVQGRQIAAALKAEAATAPAPAKRGLRTLETLEDGECRYPIGDPQHPAFTYCGRRTEPRRDYCPKHDQSTRPPEAAVKKLDERLGITAAMRGR